MNAVFRVAQAAGAPAAQRVVVTKPADAQAVTLHLEKGAQLDLSAIAGEQITLVHAGSNLVVVFANKATVTIEPFFGPDGKPLQDLSVDLGSKVVSADQFAALVPITEDQSVIPAADGPSNTGGQFAGPNVDP